MKLKLPATNLTYVILCIKYTLNGEECACNMHMVNDNKMGKVEIDTPDEAVVTTVTMNEVTNAQKVVSVQVLYDAVEEEAKAKAKAEAEAKAKLGQEVTCGPNIRIETTPINSNLKVEAKVEAQVEKAPSKKEDYASTHSERKTKKQSKSGTKEESKSKEK